MIQQRGSSLPLRQTAAVHLPPQVGCCPSSGHQPALCPPSVARCPAAAWRGDDKSPRRLPDNPCSQKVGRRRPARMPPRRVPERPFGSCSSHVTTSGAFNPSCSALHVPRLVADAPGHESESTTPPNAGRWAYCRPGWSRAGGSTPARGWGGLHPATGGPLPGAHTAGTAGWTEAHPWLHHRTDRRGGTCIRGIRPGGGRNTTPCRGPAPLGTGPLPVRGRGPCARWRATRPHPVRTALSTSSRPGSPRGNTRTRRLVAACGRLLSPGPCTPRTQRADTRTPTGLLAGGWVHHRPCDLPWPHRSLRCAGRPKAPVLPGGPCWPPAGCTTTPSGATAPSCAIDPGGEPTASAPDRPGRVPLGTRLPAGAGPPGPGPSLVLVCLPGGSFHDPSAEHGASCAGAWRRMCRCLPRPSESPLPARGPTPPIGWVDGRPVPSP